MVKGYMNLLKKKSNVYIHNKPIEYEKFIKIKCPICSKGSKTIFIDMPSEKLPNTIHCFVCNTIFSIKDIFKIGKEIRRK